MSGAERLRPLPLLLLQLLAPLLAGGAAQEPVVEGVGRRLVAIAVEDDWDFPAGMELAGLSGLPEGTYGSGVGSQTALNQLAGYKYGGFLVTATSGDTFGADHPTPRLRLVNSLAERDDCNVEGFFVPMAMSLLGTGEQVSAMASGAMLDCLVQSGGTMLQCAASLPSVVYMHGGTYRICYTPDGTFAGDAGKNNMVPPVVVVNGVYSSCRTDACLRDELWECYFVYRAEREGSCRIDFRTLGGRSGWGVVASGVSKMTWTPAWAEGSYLGSDWQSAERQKCADSTAGFQNAGTTISFESGRFVTFSTPYLDADNSNFATMPALDPASSTSAFTLTACYCPNYVSEADQADSSACSSGYEFIQPVGIIRYWTFSICNTLTYPGCGTGGVTPYMRILPQQPFVLKVLCPAGGCSASDDNRIKFISADPLTGSREEKLQWEASHRCKLQPAESSAYAWLPSETGSLGGGSRQDYKVWPSPYLALITSTGSALDVCYCDSDCDKEQNYFKVGVALTVDSFGLARRTAAETVGTVEPINTIEYINADGSITLYGGITSPVDSDMRPYDSPPFGRKALVKLISFDRDLLYDGNGTTALTTLEKVHSLDTIDDPDASRKLDAACSSTGYSADLVIGPSDVNEAKIFTGQTHSNTLEGSRLPFSGSENDQVMSARKAGTLAICYCATIAEDETCADDRYWIYANRIQIRGAAEANTMTFPTNFVVRIQFAGWGFRETDTVRLISMTQTCSENAYSPAAVGGFRLGCPGINETSCRLATLDENIETVLASSNTTGLYISRVEPGVDNTTLVFTGDIADVISEGDAIVIDDRTVLLNGKSKANWTRLGQYQVSRLTGVYLYADEMDDEEPNTRELAVKVNYFHSDQGLDKTRLVVPVSIDTTKYEFAFSGEGGAWKRTSYLETKEELKIETATQGQVCWGAQVDGLQKYYATVGNIQFVEPSPMADAGVHLTSRVPHMESQVVIAFTPTFANPAYKAIRVPLVLRILFRDLDGMLMPRVAGELGQEHEELDPNMEVPIEEASQALCGRLFVEMWTNDAEGFPMPKGCYLGPVYQDKPSVDPYTLDVEPTLPRYREYFVVFEPRNGLKSECYDYRLGKSSACSYMLVLNAFVHTLSPVDDDGNNQEPVSIFTMCANHSSNDSPCGPPYSVIEYGKARASRITLEPQTGQVELGSVDMAPLGSEVGNVTLQNPFEMESLQTSLGEFSFRGINLEFRSWPKDKFNPIYPKALLRIYFFPLTIWDLGFTPGCQANCISPDGHVCGDGIGGTYANCFLEQVVAASGTVQPLRQVLRLEYPPGMSVIFNQTLAHRLEVRDLRLPQFGYWPTAFMAQLTDDEDKSPSVVLVANRTYHLPPPGASSGKLLVEGQAGSGPLPFVADKGNEVVVRIMMGLALSNYGNHAAEPPKFDIELPRGYNCFIVGNGIADPDGTQELFELDANGDGFLDYYRNTLTSGQWTSDRRWCTFTLDTNTQIWAGQVFYVLLSTYNPKEALLRDDPENIWHINYTGAGSTKLGPGAPFISLEEEALYPGWAGNLAVLLPLTDECLQPLLLERHAANVITVFFRVTHSMPFSSYVVLDAPVGFDFGAECQISDLDPTYYADWQSLAWGEDITGPNSLTRNFGTSWTCNGSHWELYAWDPTVTLTTNYTRAILRVGRAMPSGTLWGFSAQVQNAPAFSSAQHGGWKLWIWSPEGYPVDGSKYTLQFNAERIGTVPDFPYDRSWGIYAAPLEWPAALVFPAPSLHPTSVQKMSTQVTVYPIESTLGFSDLVSVRVLSPVGYEWDLSGSNGFQGSIEGVTCADCTIAVSPQAPFPNELVLDDVVLRTERLYGFTALLKLPDRPPFRSMNAFFIEVGYNSDVAAVRMQAGMIDPPRLQVVYDATALSLSNVATFAGNVLEFRMTISTPIPANAGFVFQGDEATRNAEVLCWPGPLEGTLGLPEEASCAVFRHEVTGLPVIMLGATEEGLPVGTYGFRFEGVTNANLPTEELAYWTVGTYTALHDYPVMQVLDLATRVPAARVLRSLVSAGLLTAPEWESAAMGRDDRPDAQNRLTFYFRLAEEMPFEFDGSDVVVALRGPPGFVFEENCLGMLHTLPVGVTNMSDAELAKAAADMTRWPCSFNTSASSPWCPAEFSPWPAGLQFSSCVGIRGNTAKLSIPNAFSLNLPAGFQGKTFAFQVGVQNPVDNTSINQWGMDVGDEGSLAFHSFRVQTFDVATSNLTATSHAVAPQGAADDVTYLPFALHFTPYNSLPGASEVFENDEGKLILDAPAGFSFYTNEFGHCLDSLLEVAGSHPSDTSSKFYRGLELDMFCFVRSDTRIEITMVGAKPLLSGTTYRLVFFARNPLEPKPAEYWLLHSYKRRVTTGQVLSLDRTWLAGFEVYARAQSWQVENVASEVMGLARVFYVDITLQLSEPLRNGDFLTAMSPPGFDLDAGGGSCDGFDWTTVVIPLPSSPPACSCDEEVCWITFEVLEGSHGDIALQAGYKIAFRLSTSNPAANVDQTENWWTITHNSADGGVVETAVYRSWTIYGRLLDVALSTEVPLRAGATTTIHLVFTPQVFGSSIELTVATPEEFDFSGAAVNPPLAVDPSSEGPKLVVTGASFFEFETVSLQIDNVVLGRPGGPVMMSLHMSDLTGAEVARRLNIYNVYRLPGEMALLDQRLRSEAVVDYYDKGAADAVLPLIPSFTGALSRVELIFRSSVDVAPGEQLVLKSIELVEGSDTFTPVLSPMPDLTVCQEQGSGYDEATGDWKCNSTGGNVSTSGFSMLSTSPDFEEDAYGLTVAVDQVVPAESVFRLRVWGMATANGATFWELTVEDGTELPKSTNDRLDTGIGTVGQLTVASTLEFRTADQGAPPRSKVAVTLTVQAEQEVASLLVLLPLGYAPEAINWAQGETQRYIIKVPLDTGVGDITGTVGRKFLIKAFSPSVTNADTRWFAFAYGRDVDAFGPSTLLSMVGWGSALGFPIQNLPVKIMFPAIAMHQGWLSLVFKVDNDIPASYMLLTAPPGFVPRCPAAGMKYSDRVCSEIHRLGLIEVPGVGVVDNSLNVSLEGGGVSMGDSRLFSFCVQVDTPGFPEAGNKWSLRLVTAGHSVVEAAVDIEGPAFNADVMAERPFLAWSPEPQHGETATVTFEITLLQKVKFVHALLFSLPEMYRHDIIHINQVKSLNKLWPVAVGIEWRYYQDLRWIRMLTEVAFSDRIDAVPSGTFQFQFPVRVPMMEPAISEWYLSFCSSIYCKAYEDPDNVMVAFPVPNDATSREAAPFAVQAAAALAPSRPTCVGALLLALAGSAAALAAVPRALT